MYDSLHIKKKKVNRKVHFSSLFRQELWMEFFCFFFTFLIIIPATHRLITKAAEMIEQLNNQIQIEGALKTEDGALKTEDENFIFGILK